MITINIGDCIRILHTYDFKCNLSYLRRMIINLIDHNSADTELKIQIYRHDINSMSKNELLTFMYWYKHIAQISTDNYYIYSIQGRQVNIIPIIDMLRSTEL